MPTPSPRSAGSELASGTSSRVFVAWIVILLVAAGLRVYAWQHTAAMFNDGPIFLGMAEAFATGRVAEALAHPFHPLYPAATALVSSLLGLSFEAGAIAVAVAGGLMSIIGVFLAVRNAFDEQVAWLSAWIVALHPWAVDFSSDIMSDSLYAGLFLLGFAALTSCVLRPRFGSALACGVLTGLAYLARPEGLGLGITALLLIGGSVVAGRRDRRAGVVAVSALTLGSVALMTPLLASNFDRTGEFALSQKKSVGQLAAGLPTAPATVPSTAPTTIPLPRSAVRVRAPVEVTPPRTFEGGLDAASRALRTSLAALRYEVALFVVIGWVALRGRRDRLRESMFVLPAILYTGLLILLVWGAGYVARRHALAALLPLVAYAAIGWRALIQGSAERLTQPGSVARARLGGAGALTLSLVLVLSLVWGARDLRERRPDRVPVRMAATWLADNVGEGQRVAAQKLRVAYYARSRFIPLPSGKDEPIEAALRRQNARFVIIDEVRLDHHIGLAAGLGDWLHILHRESAEGRQALILELR